MLEQNKFKTKKQQQAWNKTLAGRYYNNMVKRPFLFFGLPFLTTIYVASVYFAEFTAYRYELQDGKVKALSEEEALKLEKGRRKVDIKDEFYRLQQLGKQDDWEQVRVPRMKGESENVF
ncbi:Cytochrome c oxidase assembly protein COX16 [Yarrowia sp. C11]|nr:Cytochrome c oxidase assembly protein COX16 [Yarrowia sp. E02]KAG5373405.1 Cytochrome c oxidase assembly protein COX16 [Yarrowia sp. C11]